MCGTALPLIRYAYYNYYYYEYKLFIEEKCAAVGIVRLDGSGHDGSRYVCRIPIGFRYLGVRNGHIGL